MERKLSRRNILGAAGAFAGGAVIAVPAVASISTGDDAELLAMIARAKALWARQSEVGWQATLLVRELRDDGEGWDESLQHPRYLPLAQEEKALGDAAMALDEPIRNYKPRTLEGAVAQAEFFRGDDDFREILLPNLRRIVEGRS